MGTLTVINIISYFIMLSLLGYYIITTLQWYSYKFKRVVFHHTKSWWNIVYFFAPLVSYDIVVLAIDKKYSFFIAIVYLLLFLFWLKGVDKKLVFTGRVKRFFSILIFIGLLLTFIFKWYFLTIPIFLTYFISNFTEKLLFINFKNRASKKLESMSNLIIIGVTASYGKTSIKNYLASILSSKYRVYATPRSVNTLGGIVKDINEELLDTTQIYIVEMGARAKGDILEITTFVKPHYSIIGKIGSAHIEYFKSLGSIIATKMEILQSPRLKKAWVHKSTNIKPNNENIVVFGDEIRGIEATLEQTCFSLENERYCTNILGAFNATNLAVSILVAKEFGLNSDSIKKELLKIKPTPHRLQRVDAGGKLILDDSFNGNIDGVLASFELCSLWKGRKVLITAGLVEVDEASNVKIAKRADEVFDMIVVTSSLNSQIFKQNVQVNKFVQLLDKSKLQDFLRDNTRRGDLILFSNDAPSFV